MCRTNSIERRYMEKAIENEMREAYKEESKEYDFHYSIDEIIFTLNIIDYIEHGNISEEVALTLFSLDDMLSIIVKIESMMLVHLKE